MLRASNREDNPSDERGSAEADGKFDGLEDGACARACDVDLRSMFLVWARYFASDFLDANPSCRLGRAAYCLAGG